ncbi:hypothetical protein OA253_02705 [Alphaproteobacteria bacterium]|nr:hypothetical protein [Alphaproteobacteria bacterium]
MDFHETQKKYRKKSFKVFINLFFKIILIALSVLIGWRIGASDNEILLLENEKKLKSNELSILNLEEQIVSIKLKLKESNRALREKNIVEGKNYGFEAKKVLAFALANGVPEEKIINHIRILTGKEKCRNSTSEEMSVSTENFIPPNSFLTLLGGGLRLKAEGVSIDNSPDKPFFDPNKPINVSLIYFGGTETLTEKLPISKKIYAGKFVVNLIIKKSNVRGSIIVRYNTCKL